MPYSMGPIASDTLFGGATTPAPGAASNVCTVTVVTPGIYQLQIYITLTGTVETQNNNVQLVVPGGLVVGIPALSGVQLQYDVPRVFIKQTGLVAVKSVAAATAGSVYTAFICATRVG